MNAKKETGKISAIVVAKKDTNAKTALLPRHLAVVRVETILPRLLLLPAHAQDLKMAKRRKSTPKKSKNSFFYYLN
jgi:hypothetical protein